MTETSETKSPTIADVISQYLRMIEGARSASTHLAYRKSLLIFTNFLSEIAIDANAAPIENLSENLFAKFLERLHGYAPKTEQLHLQAVKGFYLYVDSEKLARLSQSRLTILIRQRSRKPGKRLPQSEDRYFEILLKNIQEVQNLIPSASADEAEATNAKLRAYRDRAFLITLADTGFRVHEACNLRRGDIDWNEGRAIIIGKGDKEAVVRFTTRSMRVIKEYLAQRAELDGSSGRPLSSLPLFARHDKGAGKRVVPITTTTGRNIVRERVEQFLGKELVGKITPHSFRHYFVTATLRGTGNLAIAKKLARHENIAVTERYAHLTDEELDKAYYDVFENETE